MCLSDHVPCSPKGGREGGILCTYSKEWTAIKELTKDAANSPERKLKWMIMEDGGEGKGRKG